MSSKQAYIDFILEQLQNGSVSFERVFELFLTKFNAARPTFAKYWKLANEQHSQQREAIEKAKQAITITQEIEAVKTQIKTKEQILERLNEIINQEHKVIGGEVVLPSFSDINKAIDTYCKIQGYHASTKQELSIDANIKHDSLIERIKLSN